MFIPKKSANLRRQILKRQKDIINGYSVEVNTSAEDSNTDKPAKKQTKNKKEDNTVTKDGIE